MPALIISLDYEMFWGVTDSKTIFSYGANVVGEWQAIPAMLKIFKKYNIHATWATVGMLMCKDYKQWSELLPDVIPIYKRESCSTYSVAELAREHPQLFFAPSLVQEILATDGQELGGHTYSHYYCNEAGSTTEQFRADLECFERICSEYKVKPTSLVFPRNQILDDYLKVIIDAGYLSYRGNQDNLFYREGHMVSGLHNTIFRLIRLADSCVPLTSNHVFPFVNNRQECQIMNIPASQFLRPVTRYPLINRLRLNRIKAGMTEAAKNKAVFHLWWHPHNFGQQLDENLFNLEELLKHYLILNQDYGMKSLSMAELEIACRAH
jgi:Polysaccharide deacetylase